MLNKLWEAHFKKRPDEIAINIERADALLMVRLAANNRLRARMQCMVEADTTILIGDIQHYNENSDYNKGYGSLMMEKLLDYAKETDFNYIYGNLSEVDLDHKERLYHFYRKHGFIITEYPEPQGNYYGKIELHL